MLRTGKNYPTNQKKLCKSKIDMKNTTRFYPVSLRVLKKKQAVLM